MEDTDKLLTRRHLYADREQWNKFLHYFLLVAGVAFTVAGISFFFAYNWDELPKFVKMGIVEVLLIASVLSVVFTSWSKLVKQIILMGATCLIGTLFAVYGQIYQTGADAYDLFFGWSVFAFLWVIAIRFAPLWLMFIVLVCTTLWLYAIQIVSDNEWLVAILGNLVTWLGVIAVIVAERMRMKNKLNNSNLWFITTMSLAVISHTSFLIILAIMNKQDSILISLITTVLLFTAGTCFGWKKQKVFYISTTLFATLVILIFLIIRYLDFSSDIMLHLTFFTIIGTTAIIYITSLLKKQWDEAKK